MKTLTGSDIEQFLEKGYVKIPGAFPRAVAEEWSRDCFRRLGYDMTDTSTWAEKRIHMSGDKYVEVAEFAPRVYEAICDLVGEDRLAKPCRWSDHFIVNLGLGADEPWQPASPATSGWHKDGDFFRHFLDSPEQGLLVFVNWTDVVHQGGPTYIATDSVPIVARFLAERPEGVLPGQFGFADLVGQCTQFEEAVAEAGDVYLLHPFVLHAASQNPLHAIRIITNPPVHLTAPMDFDRPDPADFSPIELGVLRGLGVDRYPFRATHDRERIVPERVKRQERMRQEELERQRQAAMDSGASVADDGT
jgi:hypothetical protein